MADLTNEINQMMGQSCCAIPTKHTPLAHSLIMYMLYSACTLAG